MQYDDQEEIKRHADGSIDYSHYINIGRVKRAQQARWIVGDLFRKLSHLRELLSLFGKLIPAQTPEFRAPLVD